MATVSRIPLYLCLLLFISAGLIHEFNKKPYYKVPKQESATNLNNVTVNAFHMGFRRLISSILWIQTLIESDTEHYKKKDLNNWLYLRFKNMTQLDPLFLEAYQYGGVYLSIVKDDDLGAKDIYDKGLSKYPDDYYLLLNSGFHYLFELKDEKKAYEILKKIKDHPKTPFYWKTVISRLAYENNDFDIAETILENSIKNSKNEMIKEKLKERLERVKEAKKK